MFTKAIVRTPCRNIVNGLTTANLGIPDYDNALVQHEEYIKALQKCGLDVIVLEPDENYPDSAFIEDVALLTPKCAIITNPGAPSRKGETLLLKNILKKYYRNIETIENPGTVEAGDILMVEDHFYIGISERTNKDGAHQVTCILEKYGIYSSIIELHKVLHLKTGLAYLDKNNLVASREFLQKKEFQKFNILSISEKESYAANCVFINGTVLIPEGFPESKSTIEEAGYQVYEIDVSEFQKLDGGISCLSLRF